MATCHLTMCAKLLHAAFKFGLCIMTWTFSVDLRCRMVWLYICRQLSIDTNFFLSSKSVRKCTDLFLNRGWYTTIRSHYGWHHIARDCTTFIMHCTMCNVRWEQEINCLQACKQLTKTFGSKHPALDWLTVVYCPSVNFATSLAMLLCLDWHHS